jgi:hypothetical protein
MSRVHLSEEEVYDIFRNIFNEEDALAATIQLFGGDPITGMRIMNSGNRGIKTGTVERS